MPHFEKTERTRLRRMPERASYDAAVVGAILAEGVYCLSALVLTVSRM